MSGDTPSFLLIEILGKLSSLGAELAWMDDASCASVGGDFWHPDKGGSVKEAKRVCAGCPVRAECLEYALAIDDHYGIYGGLSVRERRRVKRQRQGEAA